jgi:hypothetical protein
MQAVPGRTSRPDVWGAACRALQGWVIEFLALRPIDRYSSPPLADSSPSL